MRSKTAALALALALSTSLTTGALFVPSEAQAQSRYSYNRFYEDLAPSIPRLLERGLDVLG